MGTNGEQIKRERRKEMVEERIRREGAGEKRREKNNE